MKRKAISSLLCVLAILQMSVTPAYAANTTQQTSTPGNQSATITYDQGSKFTVTIPKTIALDKTKTDTYSVKVEGDISADEAVTVTPDSTITLNDADGKDAVTGNIEQTKTKFTSTEVNQADGASATGTITANDLTAGDWSGSITFTIGKAQEVIGEDVTLTSNNRATYGIATTGDVEIPEYVTDSDGTKHKVVGIGNQAFYSCSGLTSITIPDSVTSIGESTFFSCRDLTSVTIPDSVTSIGNNAFSSCTGLTSITIPDSITSIGNSAFSGCTGLTSITIPDSVTSIGTRAFSGCTGLTSITIQDSVTSIGKYAFEGCSGLTSITIPDSVTSIVEGAFEDCSNLASVTYKGQTYISKSALTKALKDNKVTLGIEPFYNTALTD